MKDKLSKESKVIAQDYYGRKYEFLVTERYGIDDIKKVQNILLVMADKIHKILSDNGIQYFISFGTLLGAVRHGGYIPWDDDFDIFLFEDQYEEAMDLLRKELPFWMIVHDKQNDPIYWPYWSRIRDIKSEAFMELWADDNYYKYKGINFDVYKLKRVKRKDAQLAIYYENVEHYTRKFDAGLMEKESYLDKISKLQTKIVEEQKCIESYSGPDDEVFYFVIYNLNKIEINDIFPLKIYNFEGHQFWGPNNADALLTYSYKNYMEVPEYEKRRAHYSEVKYLDCDFKYQ